VLPQRRPSIEGYSNLPASISSRKRWDKLFAKLVQIDRRKVARIAPSLLGELGEMEAVPAIEDVELSKLWTVLGGLTGLQALQKNSAILVEMALYWQQWSPDVLVTTERLRSDARKLKWHLSRLEAASRTGKLRVTVPFYAPQALCIYYRMTRDLLGLYEASNRSMFALLRKVL
jgi:hypothetical protein